MANPSPPAPDDHHARSLRTGRVAGIRADPENAPSTGAPARHGFRRLLPPPTWNAPRSHQNPRKRCFPTRHAGYRRSLDGGYRSVARASTGEVLDFGLRSRCWFSSRAWVRPRLSSVPATRSSLPRFGDANGSAACLNGGLGARPAWVLLLGISRERLSAGAPVPVNGWLGIPRTNRPLGPRLARGVTCR